MACTGGDETNGLVFDIGTYQVKAGYAGEDTPKYVFPSVVGTVGGTAPGEAMDVDGGAAPSARQLHMGTHALSVARDGLEVASPFRDGVLHDWELVEGLLDHAFKQQMRAQSEVHPLMFAEPTHNTNEAREKLVTLLFEKYNAPAVFLAKNAVLSSFATGRQTSLVVDAGHESIVVAAVHDGFVLNKSVVRTPVAGQLLSRCMLQSVEAKGTQIQPRYAFKRFEKSPGQFEVQPQERPNVTASYRAYCVEEIARDVKETICRVSDNVFDPEENAHIPTTTYELPDSQEIAVGTDRFAVAEVMFNPPLLRRYGDLAAQLEAGGVGGGVDSLQGLHLLVNEAVNRVDVDVRRELYGSILLTGGTAGFTALRERLEKEVADIAPPMAKVKVVCPTNAVERRYSTWIGGSILASLGSFQQMWMSRKEYQEHGAGLIHKKSP